MIIRFKKILNSPKPKLFVMIFVNGEHGVGSDTFNQKIIDFNNEFSNYTSNYKLLCIKQFKDTQNSHIFTKHDNIDFLELHTLSNSSGLKFINNLDNVYLSELLSKSYDFDIQNVK
jgi:hypothetical protein